MAASESLVSDLDTEISWESSQSHLLLNPHLPPSQKKDLEALAHEFQQSGVLWIASSGSAQKENESLKLIALKKSSMKLAAAAANEHLGSFAGMEKKDVWIQVLPRFHVGGLAIELRALLASAPVVNALQDNQWSAKKFVEVIEQNQGTLSSLVPTQVHDLVSKKLRAPKSMRAIIVGGAALAESLYREARSFGWPLLPSFGLTECGSQLATAELKSLEDPGFVFPKLKVLSHFQIRTNEQGQLQVQGEALFSGFAQKSDQQCLWQKRDATWWTSSDHVKIEKMDGNEYLTPLGRDIDFVKVNGEGIHLLRLREILESLIAPDSLQLETALLAIPHARRGSELVLAHTQKVSEAQALKLMSTYNERVQSLEKMQRSVLVPQIPRSALGKIQWEELRRLSLRI